MLNAEKGKKYPVKIEYMQRMGSADLNFQIGTRRPVDYAATAAKVKDADVIVFDKTGTLTNANPTVKKVVPLN